MKAFLLSLALAVVAVSAFAQSRPVLPEGTEVRVRTDKNIPANPLVGAGYSAMVSEDVLDRARLLRCLITTDPLSLFTV